jgi:type VI secretion system protein VasJ
MRGRAAALEWLGERGERAVATRSPSPDEVEALGRSIALIEEITEILGTRMEDGGSVLLSLQRALEEARARREEHGPAAAAAASPAASAQGWAAAASAPAEIQSPEAAANARAARKDLAIRLGAYLRASEPADPLGYRLPRFVSWMHLGKLPPHADGQTQIPSPQPADLLEKLEEMASNGQWAGILEQAESRFPASILWLDLHRFTVTALEAIGDDRAAAVKAICAELGLLLERLAGLETLKFQNGQPLANDRTRRWIEERIRAGSGNGENAGPAPDGRASGSPRGADPKELEEFGRIRGEARQLSKNKKLAEAIQILSEGAQGARSLRMRATWKLEAARLCMEAGRIETAAAQLHLLDEELRASSYEDWEPSLSLDVLKSLYECMQRSSASSPMRSGEDQARARAILERVCRLDPAAALSLEGRR